MRETAQKLGVLLAVGALVVLGARLAGRTQGGGAASAPEIEIEPARGASSAKAVRAKTAPPGSTPTSPASPASPASPSASGAPSGVAAVVTDLDRRAEWELGSGACSPHQFGDAIALSEDALLVGAPRRDYAVDRAGGTPSACLYRREAGGWAFAQKVLAKDPPRAEGFARAVALGPGFAVVGAAGHENGDGATHDYARGADGTLALRAELAEPSGASEVFAEYGAAVASDARFVFVGAHLDGDKACEGCGAVFVFDRTKPGKPTRLRGRTPHENFGTALAVSGELLVVGAAGTYSSGKLTGAAYVFRREGEAFRELCRLPGATPGEEYGGSVAVDGARARVVVAGAAPTPARLTVHEVRGDACALAGALAIPLGAVAVRGDWIAAGQPKFDGGAASSGRVALVHLRADGTPELRAWLLPPRPRAYAFFGAAVALSATEVVAGAPGIRDDGSAFLAGAKL